MFRHNSQCQKMVFTNMQVSSHLNGCNLWHTIETWSTSWPQQQANNFFIYISTTRRRSSKDSLTAIQQRTGVTSLVVVLVYFKEDSWKKTTMTPKIKTWGLNYSSISELNCLFDLINGVQSCSRPPLCRHSCWVGQSWTWSVTLLSVTLPAAVAEAHSKRVITNIRKK